MSLGHALGIPFGRLRGATIAPIPPNIITATVEDETPTKVYINFAWNLDDTSVPDSSAFTLAGKTISGVVITGATITLTVTVAYVYGDVITVDYTMPVVDPLKQESTGASILSWVGWVVTNYVHTPEVSTYIDGLITPLSDGQITLLNTLVASLKVGLAITNLSDVFDTFYVLAGETYESSLKNLVKNAHHATAVNAPTFTALEGFTGIPASLTHISCNYNPNTEGIRFTRDSAMLGAYGRLNLPNALETWMGTATTAGGAKYTLMTPRYLDTMYCPVNSGTNPTGANTATTPGIFAAFRDDSTHTRGYRNKTKLIDDAVIASVLVPSNDMVLLCRKIAAAFSAYTTNQLAFAWMGKTITEVQYFSSVDAMEAYMDANGRGVIS